MNEGGDEIAASSDSHAKAFWREAYQNWNTYRHFQPKILVAGDVLESMQLRLTFFLHNKEESEQVTVKWPPFDHGLRQVSYSKLIWHHFRKEKEKSWIEDAYEKDWVEFCLWYAEVGYIRDLQSKGFTLCGVDENMLALDIRKEMVQYVTVLKQDRNVSAHIFSTAIQQKTSDAKGERSRPKVRTLLDSAVFDLSAGMKGNLLRMIQDLTVRPPEVFQDLKLCFKMQLHFLKHVLENHPAQDQEMFDVAYEHCPPPPEFPRGK